MKKLFILCIFALLALSTTLTFAQSQNWADYGLSEEDVKYLSDEEKQEILNSRTPKQTEEYVQQQIKEKGIEAVQAEFSFPFTTTQSSGTSTNSEVVSCFDYYTFGSIEADMTSQTSNVVSGMNMEFFGNIKNKNPYPIIQGTLYVKIFKNVGGEKNSNGPDVVDEFVVLDNLNIPANGSIPVDFSWNVPAYAQTGDYQLVTFFTSDQKFNLLGLSFTDDIVGNSFNFSVSGEDAGVMFDKTSVMINDNPYYFAAYPPRISEDMEATFTLSVDNTTNQTQSTQIKWKLYRWDAMNPDNLIREFSTATNIDPNSSVQVEFLIPEKEEPVYYLVGELMYQDSKSIVGIRFVREGVDRVRLNFPSINSYPLVKGEQTTLFTCLHNSGQSPQVPNNKVVLEIQDERGRVIESYTYEGEVTGDMMAVKKDFVPKVNLDVFSVKASLYTDNKLVDESIMKYDCKLIDPTKCTGTNWLQTMISLIGGLILLSLIWLLIKKYKTKQNLILPLFILVFSFGVLSVPSMSEARSVSWNTVVNKNFAFFFDRFDVSGWGVALANPNITVKYNVEIRNADTNALISNNDSVPVGTNLKLKFLKHKSSDLYWFGTGYGGDSPYGEWITDAEPPAVSCKAKDFVNRVKIPYLPDSSFDIFNDIYIPLSIDYPEKTITKGNNLTCDPLTGNENNGYEKKCTVTGTGNLTPEFNFEATTGKFYYRYYSHNEDECFGNNVPIKTTSDPRVWSDLEQYSLNAFGLTSSVSAYTLDVPAQTITYNLTATEVAPTNTQPNAPTITGPTTGYTSTSHTFSFTATDPDGDTIKYGVDWNNDGTVDQWLPSSGYIGSGVLKERAKSWGNDGVKTFQARTQDENGALSGWTSHTITLTFQPVNGVCYNQEEFMCNPGTASATSTNNSNVSRWSCLGSYGGTSDTSCVYNPGQASQSSCIAPTVQLGTPSVYTASPSGSNYTYKWYSSANQTNALTSFTSSRTYTDTYSQTGSYPLWVDVKKSNGNTDNVTCTAVVGCGAQPANGVCKSNGFRTIYDSDSCRSDGTWEGTEESCVTGEPNLNQFIFNPNIASAGYCPLTVDVDSVSSCWVENRANQATTLSGIVNESLNITGFDLPVGTYTLHCKGVDAASSTPTEFSAQQACFSNADSRED